MAIQRQPNLIVGREREQQRLRNLLDQTIAGQGALAMVSGEAGIGKTTLVNDLIEHAQDRGTLVLTGGCYDLTTTPPYGPWAEIARNYLMLDPENNQLPPYPDLLRVEHFDELGSQTAFFNEAASFFKAVASHRPLLIVLEDMHWSDDGSLDLLRALGREMTDQRLLLAVTYRSDELTRRDALYRLMPLLVRESAAERINLRQFTSETVCRLIDERYCLPDVDTARLVDYLVQYAEGNPFFTGEMLFALEEERYLQPAGDGWRLTDLSQVQVPPLVQQMIDVRIRRLDAETRAVLQIAAIIGQEFTFDLLQEVLETDRDRLLEMVDLAIELQLLEEAPGDSGLRFHHALVREALYEGLARPRRRIWHRRIGELLADTPQPDPDAVAYHFQQANDDRAVDWLTAAGHQARQRYTWGMAAERYDAAASLLETSGTHQNERARLLYQCALALTWVDHHRGLQYIGETISLSEEIGDHALHVYARFRYGGQLCSTGQIRAGIAMMEVSRAEMMALNADQHAEMEELHKGWSYAMSASSSISKTLAVFLAHWYLVAGYHRKAINTAIDGQFDASDEVISIIRYYAIRGQPGTAIETVKPLETKFEESLNLASVYSQVFMMVAMTYLTDNLVLRQELYDKIVCVIIRDRRMIAEPTYEAVLGIQQVYSGEWHEARRKIQAIGRHHTAATWEHTFLSILATLIFRQGDIDEATNVIQQVLPDGPATEPGDSIYLPSTELLRIGAEIELQRNDLDEAQSWIDAHDFWLAWGEAVLGQADGELLKARLQLVRGDPSKSRQHANRALALATDPRQPLTLMGIHRFLGHLDIVDGDLTAASEHLAAAHALADVCDLPYELALTLLAEAELATAKRQQESARSLLDDARKLLEPMGAQLALEDADEIERELDGQGKVLPGGLTQREAEVLCLVAEDLTDALVAEQLYISPRTVGQHLRNIYNKLGVNSRTAAVRWAVEQGLV